MTNNAAPPDAAQEAPSRTIGVTFDAEDYEAVTVVAKDLGLARAAWIRMLVMEALRAIPARDEAP